MQDIIVTNSDKGNKTVVLTKIDYINKIMAILSDNNIYNVQAKDNTKSIANKLIDFLKSYQQSGYFNYRDYSQLYPCNYNIPTVYALIKIHKENNPARLICPYQNHPLSKLSNYLSKLISPVIRQSQHTLRDSVQL